MNNVILDNEIVVRLGFFFGVFAVLALSERLYPRRVLSVSKSARWFTNLIITVLNSLLPRWVFPIGAVAMAFTAQRHGWGLLNIFELPGWLKTLLGVIGLDLAVYTQHVVFHAMPTFWRLHMIHHTDLDFDVTTGVRFHPIEIVLSMCIKLMVVFALGPPAAAVLIFEVLLNATSMFNHSNIRLTGSIDRLLRMAVVTPDMHRVHHSTVVRETNSNFGFNLPWWDRLFGTYRRQPEAGHEAMNIGLSRFRDLKSLSLPRILALPFMRWPG